MLEGIQTVEVTPNQKSVFLFLHTLYTNCSYLQSTFRSRFGHLCMQLGDAMLADSYSPLASDMQEWQKILPPKLRLA